MTNKFTRETFRFRRVFLTVLDLELAAVLCNLIDSSGEYLNLEDNFFFYSPKRMSDDLLLSESSQTHILKRLESKGFISIRVDPHSDGRQIRINYEEIEQAIENAQSE